ncbi:hypothetical protein [Actinomadura sediminis]|uniref:DUF998 domain-containing protein n=1 Tax=Actinomadura sediminis TaxID=1038904 RepID=A0ABW3EPI2_9ACTN
MSVTRRHAPVIGLFLLAPFVGEYLLGNLSPAELPLGFLLAPLYGGGALLVRELGRRYGSGWPSMALLAAAHALIEEGPVDQLLWNDSYAGVDMLHGPSFLPSVGMSVELTQTVLALHGVWSMCVPIAIVETLARGRRTTPWLGRTGLIVTGLVYAAGSAFVFWGNHTVERFVREPAQIAGVTAIIVALVACALLVRFPDRAPSGGRPAPSPWLAGAAALAVTSAYWGPLNLITADWYEWWGVAVWCAVLAAGVPAIWRWSGRPGWGVRHRFALAAGAACTYVWTAFPVRPEGGGSATADLVGNAVFGTIGVVILVMGGRAARDTREEADVEAPRGW